MALIDTKKEERIRKIEKIRAKEIKEKRIALEKNRILIAQETALKISEAINNFKEYEKNKTIENERIKIQKEEDKIKNKKYKKCIDCGEDFQSKKNRCKKCYNIFQRNVQRQRSSSVEGYLKQILSSIKNGKTRKSSSITLEDLLEIYEKQDGKCAITGIEMTLGDKRNGSKNPYSLSVDRIDNELGYTKENIWLVLTAVNQFKNCYALGDIFKISRAIYEENCFSNSVY